MNALEIYRNGLVISTVTIDEETVLLKKIMNAHKITSVFESEEVLPLQIGDYILYDGDRYSLLLPPTIDKRNNRAFKYTVVFHSVLYDLYNKMLISSDGLSDFSYVGDANEMLTLIVEQMQAIDNEWAVGEVDASNGRTFLFNSDSCRTALTKIAEGFGFEFDLVGKTINFKKAIGSFTNHVFEYGQGKGLYTITRKPVESNTLYTRVYGYGGEKNIPYTYRDRAKRLVFQERFLEKNINVFGVREAVFIDDEIYPQRTAALTGVNFVITEGQFNAAESYVEDDTLNFDIGDYLAEGLVAKIVFKSGKLAGNEFEIHRHDFNNHRIYFNPYTEVDGFELPSEAIRPEVGDTYTLINMNMPAIYVIEAEAALKQATQKYLDDNSVPKTLYLVKIDAKYSKANAIDLKAGDLVTIKDPQLGINSAIRISQLSYPLVNRYKMSATIADFIPYTLQERISIVQSQQNNLVRNLSSTVNNTVRNTISNITNNNTTIINEGGQLKIRVRDKLFFFEKGFDNVENTLELEVGDYILNNWWDRVTFVNRWQYLGGETYLDASWDKLESTDHSGND